MWLPKPFAAQVIHHKPQMLDMKMPRFGVFLAGFPSCFGPTSLLCPVSPFYITHVYLVLLHTDIIGPKVKESESQKIL